ncbi:MAG: aminotransferase class I/II-fold pyridoxal phosphate-dependent enzyme [Planctomycetes bacterium]|nr:aminotransferase class I/II-fold pyridoxal phosphate-dependent enzyme [Planctomycetota bacterium]
MPDPSPRPKAEDICPRPASIPENIHSHAPPIYPASVYRCESTSQAERLLAGEEAGFVYSRDGHPNGAMLAEKCRELHGAERAVMCSSGMAALAAAALGVLKPGDHVVASNQLYGRSLKLLVDELTRWGVASSVVDTCDLAAVRAACTKQTKLVVVETISNPVLRVADIGALAQVAHDHGAALLVDNTFASPALCRPLELGADLVLESLTKVMNGHSDVLLGMLCGRAAWFERIPGTIGTWGLSAPPFDCWLAWRGLATLAVRFERAADNALAIAKWLTGRKEVTAVHYPGLTTHPDHALAQRQFGERFGTVVTITLGGDTPAADRFIAAARRVPFCPSLGELSTTLSHPASTSHRTLSVEARRALGIEGGTLRLSIGIESCEEIKQAIAEGLAAV